jgi:hypothetical protein
MMARSADNEQITCSYEESEVGGVSTVPANLHGNLNVNKRQVRSEYTKSHLNEGVEGRIALSCPILSKTENIHSRDEARCGGIESKRFLSDDSLYPVDQKARMVWEDQLYRTRVFGHGLSFPKSSVFTEKESGRSTDRSARSDVQES